MLIKKQKKNLLEQTQGKVSSQELRYYVHIRIFLHKLLRAVLFFTFPKNVFSKHLRPDLPVDIRPKSNIH